MGLVCNCVNRQASCCEALTEWESSDSDTEIILKKKHSFMLIIISIMLT